MIPVLGTPRERRHDGTRTRILDTAMRLVELGGFEALSMNKLASAVDYTPGALYRYFPSKAALLGELTSRVLDDVRERLLAAENELPAQTSSLTRVFALVGAYREFARERPERFGLLAMTMAEPRVLLEADEDAVPVANAMSETLMPLAVALGAAAESGQIAPGDVLERTTCMFALVQGALLLHKQSRYAPTVLDVDRLVVRGTRSLLLGWGAKARSVDHAIDRVTNGAPLRAPKKEVR